MEKNLIFNGAGVASKGRHSGMVRLSNAVDEIDVLNELKEGGAEDAQQLVVPAVFEAAEIFFADAQEKVLPLGFWKITFSFDSKLARKNLRVSPH